MTMPERGSRLARPTLVAVLVLLVSSCTGGPGTDSPEAGFARDMATHHAQAVEMSFVVRDKSSDEALRTLAYDIIVTQSTQRGVFMGWLQAWGLPQSAPPPRMAWMPGHEHVTGAPGAGMPLMHGMASEEELRRLRAAQGTDAEILFLQLMIRHHEGGVIMANAVAGLTDSEAVLGSAASIRSTQNAEISAMKEMLARLGARPYESLLE
jgi:uncharacterized protein (DUF305 family)